MNPPSYARAMGILSVSTIITILAAGLWPFHAPRNDVARLSKENGLRFGDHGTILSSGAFQPSGPENNYAGSLEIRLEPAGSTSRSTILAFQDSGPTAPPFMLQQSRDKLIVERRNTDDGGQTRTAELIVDDALARRGRRFVTITLGPRTTSVYLDGVLIKMSEIQGRAPGNFMGRLVLGNSLIASDSWRGEVLGLAIYQQELTPAKVLENYQDWTKYHRPMPSPDEQPAALYLFDERDGNVLHNPWGSSTDLMIPARYLLLQPAFLSPPWRDYHPTRSYWENAGINIVGFIPLGYFLVAYFSTRRATRTAATAAVLLGFLTSLTIESLQAYLPTRDSGMNDLITNTFGTVLGVLLYGSPLIQNRARRSNDTGTLFRVSHRPRSADSLLTGRFTGAEQNEKV
jgi:VanZ family protein